MTIPTIDDLAIEVRALRAEVEQQRKSARHAKRVALALVLAAVVVASGAGVANAASRNCPNAFPFCFQPNTPALAGDVNENFTTAQDWLEQKVGPVRDAGVLIRGEVLINRGGNPAAATTGAGKALFVSALSVGGAGPIAEFRHDNLSQGIGIGFNTIYATGSNTDQDLHLTPQPAGRVIVNGDLQVTGNAWSSGPTVGPLTGGRGGFGNSFSARCPNGQFVCGFLFGPSANQNWWMEPFAVECCGL